MRRRALLASAISALPTVVAGCTGSSSTLSGASFGGEELPNGSLGMTAVPDVELPTEVLYTVRADDGTDRKSRILDRTLDGGTAVKGVRPPLPEDRHLWYDGTVYRLSHEVTERTPATRYSVKVDIVEGSVDESETIRFSELPEVDRERFADHGLADGDPVGIGTTFLYTDAERERSILVPDSEYSVVVWESDSRAEWVVDDAFETTRKTYSYTAERIASGAEYGRRMRERFAFDLTGLSDAQREVIETAISEDRYVVDSDETPSSAFVSLADRFRGRERARALDEEQEQKRERDGGEGESEDEDGDWAGSYLVRYDEEVYWTRLFVRDEALRTETTG